MMTNYCAPVGEIWCGGR